MARYSRLESTEEKRNFRNAAILAASTIAVAVLLFIYGIPLAGRVALFVSDLKGGSAPITRNDKTPPAPPNFNIFPDYTNQQTLSITGTAEAGTTVRLTFNGAVNETLTDKDGNFAFRDLTLKDGENTFSAKALDAAKNIGLPTGEEVVIYDNKPPELVIDHPGDGTKFFGSTQRQINIQGSTEADTNVTINDRIVSVDGSGKFVYPVTLNGGDNTFTIKAQDPAGNTTETSITLGFNE